MAYWIQKTSNSHNMINYRYFICDYINDIKQLPRFGINGSEQEKDTISPLPCAYGSDCLCLEDSSKWVLSKDTNEWKKIISMGGSSGDGQGGLGVDIATNDEVNSVLDDVFK